MKKILRLCVVCFLLCGLTGCGQTGGGKQLNPNSPVTITVWHYYNGVQQTQFDEMVNEFNNTVGAEKGIIVDANSKNSVNELAENVLAAVNKEPGADAMPNIFGTYAETAYQIDQMGMLVDLGQYLTEEEKAEYVGAYLQEGSLGQEGVLKIFPTAKSTEIMMVNRTDWQKFADACGVTYDDMKTWEGLAEVSRKYYEYTDALTPDVPNDGKAFFGRDSVANYMMVGAMQLGHPFASMSEDGTVTVEADKGTARILWDNFYVPFVKGYYAAESRFRSDDAKIGTIIALVGSTTGAIYYPAEVTVNDEYTYPIENVVLPVPGFAGCDPYIVQQGAGMSVLKSNEKAEYACSIFLKWFTETERNLLFSVNSGYLPVKEEANDFEVISSYSQELGISETMLNTFRVATEEIRSFNLYTSPPYDRSAEVRSYVESAMNDSAAEARSQAETRIESGEDRLAVWAEYTDDRAFNEWYASFESGLKEITG